MKFFQSNDAVTAPVVSKINDLLELDTDGNPTEWIYAVACDCPNPAIPLAVKVRKPGYTVYLEFFDWAKDCDGNIDCDYEITDIVPNGENDATS